MLEETESLYRILWESKTLEEYKVKLMRDIREEGSRHEENRRYQELLIEERKRLNKKFELAILTLDEKYKHIQYKDNQRKATRKEIIERAMSCMEMHLWELEREKVFDPSFYSDNMNKNPTVKLDLEINIEKLDTYLIRK